tara:strand:+ start:1822 stop:2136 length:315 start_codon:yes stop_codon:yes gene_type:complete
MPSDIEEIVLEDMCLLHNEGRSTLRVKTPALRLGESGRKIVWVLKDHPEIFNKDTTNVWTVQWGKLYELIQKEYKTTYEELKKDGKIAPVTTGISEEEYRKSIE